MSAILPRQPCINLAIWKRQIFTNNYSRHKELLTATAFSYIFRKEKGSEIL
jgi:hypothetical protein